MRVAAGWLLGVAIFASASPSVRGQVQMTVSPQPVAMDSGWGRAQVTIVNAGPLIETVRLRSEEIAVGGRITTGQSGPLLVNLSPQELVIPPGARQQARVDLKPTRPLLAGNYTMRLVAESVKTGRTLGTAEILAVVPVRLAVGTADVTIDSGSLNERQMKATFCFPLEANVHAVSVTVVAAPLQFQERRPEGRRRTMQIDATQPVRLASSSTRSLPGGRALAPYVTDKLDAITSVALCTEPVMVRSDSDGCIAERVFVTVTWRNEELILPAGNYQARVMLNVMPAPDR